MTLPRGLISPALTLTLALLSSMPAQAGAYYRWVDAAGVTHYGATPPQGVEATIVSTYGDKKKSNKSSSSNASAYTPQNASTSSQAPATESTEQLKAERKEECKREQQRLESLQKSRGRVRMPQEDGSNRYLTIDEIAKEIDRSKTFIREACK